MTWAAKKAVDSRTRALWARGDDSTRWARCGDAWDVVVIEPIGLGLEALDQMGADPSSGYPVLADHIRDRLYVMVRAGTGHTAHLPGTRVLSRDQQLLLPCTPAAHWISTPRETAPPLLRADKLALALREVCRLKWKAAA
ncbi:hypothetical protein AR457_36185 [Streptomyces agglomeratus]|uniref:DNA primase/polymerase bifunctional N-terminal domain-containing protein n=2 Tax=Streptomyces agglomeratus TaxID=285458 RepID=A0A1E5NY87_9ACTN|nr:hypothetical protein AS594_37380 [Streptomyces agglomeratus]OEJ22725.1 hypothetical protein AR457_36185 [Streptomyces agglomeratus]OEJ36669.1 hypothetical protein BGK72_36560 [Streptomyces agglomeratus]OEJ56393.1 hypothetical protein BGM19_37475 [Streptomyces agglomeratus]